MLSPFITTRLMWCFLSLNKPGTSTLQPYWPASASLMLRMVREISPSSSRPSNWYLLETLVPSSILFPSEEMSCWLHLTTGMAPRPQQKWIRPCSVLYLHDKVTFWPTEPKTSRLLMHSRTAGAKRTIISDIPAGIRCYCWMHQLLQLIWVTSISFL